MDFGELKNDTNFVSRVTESSKAIENIKNTIQQALQMNVAEMNEQDKINYEIFLAYAVNSLYFMYLKIDGEDISKHDIKHELSRIKEVMQRNQQHLDKKLRPKVEKDVAKRLVKGGLYDFKQKNEDFKKRYQKNSLHQKAPTTININYNPNTAVNRKRKFDDD